MKGKGGSTLSKVHKQLGIMPEFVFVSLQLDV